MNGTTSIRCSVCGTITTNSDYCSNCGNLINTRLKRQLVREAKEQQKIKEESEKPPGKFSIFFKWALYHPNLLIRTFTKTLYSIWIFFGMLMGAIIAGV